jgi:hypothetical protein
MAIIRAKPRHAFSWSFNLDIGGAPLVSFDMDWLREGGRFTWAGTEYRLLRAKAWAGDFLLTADRQVLARATKESIFARRFTIHLEGRELTLRAPSCLLRRFELVERGSVAGVVVPDHLLTRACTVELPDDLTVPVQVFVFWLVAIMWRRADSSSAAS